MSIAGLRLDAERVAEVCRRFGVARLDVFGSVSRGDDGPDSDVDLLYELDPGARLGWEIENLADELAQIFGRPVRPGVAARAQRAPARSGACRCAAGLCGVRSCSSPR
jgi:hypothetical protein